jgi:hypothetical protein
MKYFNLKVENHTYLVAESRIVGFTNEGDQPTKVTFLLPLGDAGEIQLKMSIGQIQDIISYSKSPIIILR